GIGKRNPCNTCSMPTGVNSDDKFSGHIVVIKLPVKGLHHFKSFWIVHVRIEGLKTFGHLTRVINVTIESNDLIGKCRHLKIVLNGGERSLHNKYSTY